MAVGVGVIGAGTVGGGVIQTLQQNGGVIREKSGIDVELRHVAELNQALLADFNLDGVTVSNDAAKLFADDQVDIVCELIGGINPAKSFILDALNAGKHVVTANKMLLAMHGPELQEAATRNNRQLCYEAAVGGAIPIIKPLRESLAANNITAIYGILNGTCNYILTRMAREELDFETVLTQAIDKGFAETPPDLDIEGHDTAHKCQILASLAYSSQVKLEDIFVEGITRVTGLDVLYAREMGYEIKLLAVIRKVEGQIEARVHPTLVANDHQLAAISYEFNAVYVESDIADATLYYGRGAGRLPTASAVVGDVVDIAVTMDGPSPPPFRYTHQLDIRSIGLLKSRYYLRLTTLDSPGVLGKICTILGDHGVSIASCFQKEEDDDVPAHIVITTHETVESNITSALSEIDALEFITEATHVLRVLEE